MQPKGLLGMQDMHRELGVSETLFKALNSVSLDLYCDWGNATAETLSAELIQLHNRK